MHSYKWLLVVVLALGTTLSAAAQQTLARTGSSVAVDSIRGTVVDAVTGKILPGASIQALNPAYTAMTDEQGRFTIGLPKFHRVLQVSAPDYQGIELAVYEGEKEKNIRLYPAVYANYFAAAHTVFGEKRSAAIVNAQKTARVDNLSSLSIDVEMQKQLAGDIRLLTHSGTIASGSNMLIRGINSLNANTQPLYVVDGVIFENQNNQASIHLGNVISPLSVIDVNDIESITVLKDGTSIYGSKAGNGVVLITTKRGKSMATKITATATIGTSLRPTLPPMMNDGQYRVYLSDLVKDERAQVLLRDKFFLRDDPNFVYYKKYHNQTDWSDGVYQNGTTQSYSVGVNGGDEIALYNLSIGFTQGYSTLASNNFNRLNARFNSDITFTDHFKTVFDISYAQTDRKLRNDGIAESYLSQINSPGYLSLIKSPFLSPYQYSNAGDITSKLEDYDFLNIANPHAILAYGVGKSLQTNFNLSIIPEYQLTKHLNIRSMFSYSLTNLAENSFVPMYGVAPYYNLQLGMISRNHVKTQFANQSSLFSDTRLAYSKATGGNRLDVVGGMRFMFNSYKADHASGHNTGSDQVKEMSSGLSYKQVGGFDEPYKSINYYAQATYSLREKFFVEAGVSAESTSLFGTETVSGIKVLGVNWGIFPSLNASWLVSNERFMKNISFVDLLKLRAGIGQSGNDGIQSTASRTYFNAVMYSYNAIGLQIHNIGNPEIQWETVTRRNAGLDMALFGNRVTINFDLFNNTTDNLLVEKTLDPITGLDKYWTNDGKLQNNGYEVAINTIPVFTRNFQLSLGASVGSYKNKILALADGDYTTRVYGGEVLTAVGQPIGQFWGYKTDGVFETTEAAQAAGLSLKEVTGALTPFQAGDVRFVDVYPDNIIDEKDKVVIGNSNPDLYGSAFAGMKYKRLSLNVVFNYSYGNDIYNYLRSQIESGSNFYNQSMAMNNRWVNEGQVTSIPRSIYGDPKGNNRFSDRWIEDGSYLRLRTVELSYNLPVNSTYLQGITLWASANNLFTLTNYLGMDPEFSMNNSILYQGVDAGLLPQSQSFFAGVKINL